MRTLLVWLGLAPSVRDRELASLVRNSWTTLRVVGRGTLRVDPAEVHGSPGFQHAQRQAQTLVEDLARAR